MTLRRRFVLSGVLLAFLAPAPGAAQSARPVDHFDLVLVGRHLNAPTHQIALKTNPWRSNAWIPTPPPEKSFACRAHPQVHVVSGLSTARFLGQDIRENYVALKITTTSTDAAGTLRAAYALPASDALGDATCDRLATLIATDPATVRRHSVASHVRPRPASLTVDTPLIEHLEAPVRYRKPGVMEVKWLKILFRPDG
jgi:hypothetical protein